MAGCWWPTGASPYLLVRRWSASPRRRLPRPEAHAPGADRGSRTGGRDRDPRGGDRRSPTVLDGRCAPPAAPPSRHLGSCWPRAPTPMSSVLRTNASWAACVPRRSCWPRSTRRRPIGWVRSHRRPGHLADLDQVIHHLIRRVRAPQARGNPAPMDGAGHPRRAGGRGLPGKPTSSGSTSCGASSKTSSRGSARPSWETSSA